MAFFGRTTRRPAKFWGAKNDCNQFQRRVRDEGDGVKKIISLFQRNYDGDRLVRDEVVPGAEWVIADEGVATEKFDGTACLVKAGVLYKRYDAKHGKTPPPGFIPSQDPDTKTGHWPGWLVVSEGPEDRWHREAWASFSNWNGIPVWEFDGTYELVGPKVQGNRYKLDRHLLWKHGLKRLNDVPRNFDGIKGYLSALEIEGIVWHHPDGRMVKIKKKDFGGGK